MQVLKRTLQVIKQQRSHYEFKIKAHRQFERVLVIYHGGGEESGGEGGDLSQHFTRDNFDFTHESLSSASSSCNHWKDAAISNPQLLLPNRESSEESGPGCTPPRLYKIPSYIRLVLHVVNKATLLSLQQFAIWNERERKVFVDFFWGECSSQDNQKLKPTGRFLLQIIKLLLLCKEVCA